MPPSKRDVNHRVSSISTVLVLILAIKLPRMGMRREPYGVRPFRCQGDGADETQQKTQLLLRVRCENSQGESRALRAYPPYGRWRRARPFAHSGSWPGAFMARIRDQFQAMRRGIAFYAGIRY